MLLPAPSARRAGRTVAATAALSALAACSDTTSPPPPSAPRLVLSIEMPGDSASQLGVGLTAALSDSAAIRELRVYVDSARASLPAAVLVWPGSETPLTLPLPRSIGTVVSLPGPGRYSITAAVTDSGGRVVSSSFTRTVTLDSTPYTATPLPDLGAGATAVWIHADGTVTGSVTTPAGRRRPAFWRGGQLTMVAATDSGDATAVRVNAAGDVLLQYQLLNPLDTTFRSPRVLRADGTVLTFGGYGGCCLIAGDLTDTRRALAYTGTPVPEFNYPIAPSATVLDVASAQRVDSARGNFVALNGAGQALGHTVSFNPAFSSNLVTRGFTLPPWPVGPMANVCPYQGSHVNVHIDPLGLDEVGNVLATECRNAALLSAAGSVWLDRYFGRVPTAFRLSRQGGVVAALDTAAGALMVWRADTRRTARVAVAGGWRITTLGAVNATGAIAAQGVDASGRRAALLLTPAGR